MADYLSADPDEDRTGYGGLGPTPEPETFVDDPTLGGGVHDRARQREGPRWGGDIDVSTQAPGTGTRGSVGVDVGGSVGETLGGGDGDGEGIGGGVGGGIGGGIGGDIGGDSEGFW
jgi:hypothetical protein